MVIKNSDGERSTLGVFLRDSTGQAAFTLSTHSFVRAKKSSVTMQILTVFVILLFLTLNNTVVQSTLMSISPNYNVLSIVIIEIWLLNVILKV
jgi:hypothetical protein